MGFQVRTIEVIEYDYDSAAGSKDHLLAVFTAGKPAFFVYASFNNYPSPQPYLVDQSLMTAQVRQWYDGEVTAIRAGLTEERRKEVDTWEHNPWQIYCDLPAKVGRAIILRVPPSRQVLCFDGDEITELRPVTRAEAEELFARA